MAGERCEDRGQGVPWWWRPLDAIRSLPARGSRQEASSGFDQCKIAFSVTNKLTGLYVAFIENIGDVVEATMAGNRSSYLSAIHPTTYLRSA